MSERRTVAVVTGSRAEFGLLRPVMMAVARERRLQLQTMVVGAHLLPPDQTIREVAAEFEIAAQIPMQAPGDHSREEQAKALGRGVIGCADHFSRTKPDIVLVMGDRIEAFAASIAAAIAGIHIAHMHGGDRAEGIADESIRHAISKLAHIHLPATITSAQRLVAMGEQPQRIEIVGSPAIDGLCDMLPISDTDYDALGRPQIVVLLHPTGQDDEAEYEVARAVLRAAADASRILALHPNHDPGRDGIMRAIEQSGVPNRSHLPRIQFIGLLKRASVIIGNSSAGLIECSAIPLRCINVGPRQAGRERALNVIDVQNWDYKTVASALAQCIAASPLQAVEVDHPYGDGCTGQKVAKLLAEMNFEQYPLTKRNTY